MRYLLVIATALPGPAFAQTAQGDVSVTIYNNNQALVQDVRTLDLPAGRVRQEFPDVSGEIRPETVTLSGDGIGIVEQNFDFDLLSPSALMEKAVGETITLIRTNPATGKEERERAKVLAANGGVVLQIGQRIEVLRDDGLPVRVVFDKVPENLRARPTLSVTLESDNAGRRPLRLSYLSGGLGWNADYVAMIDEKAGRMDVQGWVTLTNNSGTTFSNAQTLLVAGGGGEGYSNVRPGTETAGRERLGGFYLYPLAGRTTIADRQTKQVSFLDVVGAPVSAGYRFANGWLGTSEKAQSASSVLTFSTGRDQGLGDALPAGTMRVYMRDQRGNAQFIGENNIGHTPMGSTVALRLGDAFDVKVKPVVEERQRINDTRWRTRMRYELTNAKPEPVTVELAQGGLDRFWTDTRIVEESQKSRREDSGQAVWTVKVPANGTATVTATFDTRF
ncbi:DUF4139 domain-containing protein [Allosphingosinicella flava]|nr:DUF4139 domain-containing protein [Sphingosinicella flava]